ncbi:DGQHR domain-containing protein DpdB [Sorangium sp. So ce388]|uniref:DGQHR domain-containing protein DpdB n=1 Tax=Sorangium sp. So ce388 TaxID=3133309 RepID=UPI003F5B5ED3
MTTELRFPAIEVRQSPERTLYTFAVDAKLVPKFATVSRIRRKDGDELQGYQRPEVLAHIEEIRAYVESESPMIPNAVVLAFDSRVRFEPHAGPCSPYARPGTLVIPVEDDAPEEERPGFIVDGQQRLAAIRDATVESFPICVSAFVTDDVREQTEQFILVNSTKPLPKGLIYELLPGTDTALPTLLQRRRLPAFLMTRLNQDQASPLHGMIHTVTNPSGTIKDNSVLKMLENSLSDGVLYRLRDGSGSEVDTDAMLGVLFAFWSAVKDVFGEAWGQPPKKSRLMHGAGVVSLGFLMDTISERYRKKGLPTKAMFAKDLRPLKPLCRWTDGYWDFGPGQQRKWNEVQNTTKDIQMLTNYLVVQYKSLVWNRPGAPTGRQLTLTNGR